MSLTALDDLLRHPVDYAVPEGPTVEYGPAGPGVDPQAAEAVLVLLGASVHADLDDLAAAFPHQEAGYDDPEAAGFRALDGDWEHAAIANELPHDSPGFDHGHHDQPDVPAFDPPLPTPDH